MVKSQKKTGKLVLLVSAILFALILVGLSPRQITHAAFSSISNESSIATVTPPNENLYPPSWWIGGVCDKVGYVNDQGYYSYVAATWGGYNVCYGQRKVDSYGVESAGRVVSIGNPKEGYWGEYEFQCTELVARYIEEQYGHRPYSAVGKDMVDMYVANYPSLFHKVFNGTQSQTLKMIPVAGDVLSYYGITNNPNGHTAIVTGSTVGSDGNGSLTIIQQNSGNYPTATLTIKNWIIQTPVTGDGIYDWMTTRATGGCSGTGCNGKDPATTGCSDSAYTVQSTPIIKNGAQIGTVDMRYSPKCGTNWTRTDSSVGSGNLQASIVRVRDGYQQSATASATVVWTGMLYAPTDSTYGRGCINGYCAQTPNS